MQIEIKTLHLSFLQEEDEEDGPILYRDDDNMEDEGDVDAADFAYVAADVADGAEFTVADAAVDITGVADAAADIADLADTVSAVAVS